jgi:hypothetical protein
MESPETISSAKRQGIEFELELSAREGTRFLIKAFRGAIRLDEKENRALLQAATSAVGNYTRNRATTSAMQQTALIRARLLIDPTTGEAIAGLLGAGDGA